MVRLIARRLAMSVPLLLVVSFLTFVLVSLVPGNAAVTILGIGATHSQITALESQLSLNQSLLVQYGRWLGHALTGNLGHSLIDGQSVATAIAQRLQPTVSLILASILVISIAGVGLGVLSATRRGFLARVIDLVSFGGLAVPNFVFALYLIPVFALDLKLFPSTGYVPIDQSFGQWAKSLALPVVALAIGGVGVVAKQTRAALDDVLSREFIAMLRANGYSRTSIIYKHALKAAALPILSIIGIVCIGLISGTVLIEDVFALPGLGGLAVQAASQSDLPVVEGVTVVFTLFVVVINLVLDVCYAALNPKVLRP